MLNSEICRLAKLWNAYKTDILQALRKWSSSNANVDSLIILYCQSIEYN